MERLVLLIVFCGWLFGCGSGDLSEASFERIEIGMTTEQVKEILGSSGTRNDPTGAPLSRKQFLWSDPEIGEVHIVFSDDMVVEKHFEPVP